MLSARLLFLLPATVSATYQGPADHQMWNLGADGLRVYSPDGTMMHSRVNNTEFCVAATSRGQTTQNCAFKDAVFDEQRYVWATNTQGGAFVEVFDAATGRHVQSQASCNFPYNMDHAPHLNEVWVHCWSPDASVGDTGHVDTYSTSDLSADYAQIALGPLTTHNHGQVVLDPSVNGWAWGTMLDTAALFKIDTSTKAVVAQLPIALANGFYRTSFSPVNRHLFARAYVCCSCGINEDTQSTCSTRGGGPRNVSITTGPSAGMTKPGSCGHGCEGSLADTIGVIEYDVVGETQVAAHNDHRGRGGNPYTSPLGDYTVILSNDGVSVRVLQANANGAASTDRGTVPLGYQSGGTAASVSDVAFIEDATHNIAIFVATTDNYIILVDMARFLAGESTGITKRIDLQADNTQSSSGHGRGAKRSVEWARGTNYVWVNSNNLQTIQIIELASDGDINGAALVRTLADTPSLHLVYVGPTPHYTRPALSSDSDANAASESTGLRAGEIIAIIAGVGVVLLVLVVVAVFIACKKKDAPTFHSTEMGSTKK